MKRDEDMTTGSVESQQSTTSTDRSERQWSQTLVLLSLQMRSSVAFIHYSSHDQEDTFKMDNEFTKSSAHLPASWLGTRHRKNSRHFRMRSTILAFKNIVPHSRQYFRVSACQMQCFHYDAVLVEQQTHDISSLYADVWQTEVRSGWRKHNFNRTAVLCVSIGYCIYMQVL